MFTPTATPNPYCEKLCPKDRLRDPLLSAPAGLVPGKGVVFAGIGGLHTNGKKGNDTDGSMAVGFGYGNPYETVGGAVSLSLGSIVSFLTNSMKSSNTCKYYSFTWN